MDTTQEPVDAVKSWQDWYRKHQLVASMDEPMTSKDSREQLHDTAKAMENMAAAIETEAIRKATTCFADTIAEYSSELSGADLYKCFFNAVMENLNYADKEYKKAKQLMDLLRHGKWKEKLSILLGSVTIAVYVGVSGIRLEL